MWKKTFQLQRKGVKVMTDMIALKSKDKMITKGYQNTKYNKKRSLDIDLRNQQKQSTLYDLTPNCIIFKQ